MAEETQEYLDLQGLTEYHSKINDFTTGINLLRGTKDFSLGSSVYANNLKTDGWHKTTTPTSYLTTKIDEEGFTNVKIVGRYDFFSSVVILNDDIKYLTTSFEFKIDAEDLESFNNGRQYIAFLSLRNSAGTALGSSVNIEKANKNLGETSFKADTWYKVVATIPHTSEEEDFFSISLRGDTDTSVWFRKVAVNSGVINKPIWSPSPFDVDRINDETTGINLIRGSKDFDTGKSGYSWISGRYSDGFNTSNTNFSMSKDELGYTIVSVNRTGLTSDSATSMYSNMIPVESGEIITLSLDVMVDDLSKVDGSKRYMAIAVNQEGNPTNIATPTRTLDQDSDEPMVSGEWIRKKYVYTIPEVESSGQLYVSMVLSVMRNGSFHWRAPKIERGDINNPIWSPSPFDIDRINDETTGINLLRGTRDFREGHALYDSTYYSDGFKFPANEANRTNRKSIDDEGYTVLTIKNNGLSSSSWYAGTGLVLGDFNPGEKLTVSFEFMITSVQDYVSNYFFYWSLMNKSGIVSGTTTYITFANVNFIKAELIDEKWYKAVYVITVPDNITESTGFRFGFGTDRDGEISFRKTKVERGNIENPIWSPSPFDIDRINDCTTGINLIRGSKDFALGTIPYGTADSLKLDGLGSRTASSYNFYTDEEGYTVCRYLGDSSGAVYRFFNVILPSQVNGHTVTISFEFMLENKDTNDNALFQMVKMSLKSATSLGTVKMFLYSDAGYNYKDLEVGKWYKAVLHYDTIFNLDADEYLRIAITGGYPNNLSRIINFRKVKFEIDHIENPIWSPSPLDLAYVTENNPRRNLMRQTRDFDSGRNEKSGSYTDGFTSINSRNVVKKIEDDGFTSLTYVNNGEYNTFAIGATQAIDKGIKANDVLTVSFMYRRNSDYEISSENYVQLSIYGVSDTAQNYGTISNNSRPVTDVEIGKWYKCVGKFVVPSTFVEGQFLRFDFRLNSARSDYSIKQPVIEVGYVNDPEWVSNPFDYASTEIVEEKPYLLGDLAPERAILSGTNLDTIKEPGIYYCNTDSATKTLVNCPVSQAFKMTVELPTGKSQVSDLASSYMRQTITVYNGNSRTWSRWKNSGATTAWDKWTEKADGMNSSLFPYVSGLYGGLDLSSNFAAEIGSNHIAYWLSSRASQGNFEGIHIGDWVQISCSGVTRRYVVAALDPYYNLGSPSRMGHHIAMVPDNRWALATSRDGAYAVGSGNVYIQWNTSKNNNGTSSEQSPYLASNLHKWESEVAIKQFPQEWQDVMIDYICNVDTRYSASSTLTSSTGSKWVNLGKLWSPSAVEFTGRACGASRFSSNFGMQFPIFSKTSSLFKNTTLWTRDALDESDANVICVNYLGGMNSANTDISSISPFPCFLIG